MYVKIDNEKEQKTHICNNMLKENSKINCISSKNTAFRQTPYAIFLQ